MHPIFWGYYYNSDIVQPIKTYQMYDKWGGVQTEIRIQ
jgi:hypothetical protein